MISALWERKNGVNPAGIVYFSHGARLPSTVDGFLPCAHIVFLSKDVSCIKSCTIIITCTLLLFSDE